jgi:DNA-binding transcriptional regulator PaaX
MITGAISIAATSPFFLTNLLKSYKKFRRYPKKKVSDTFYNLRKQGLIEIQKKNHQIYIGLTEKGRKKAGWLQIDSLKIKKPKKWDGKWRLVIFDISQLKNCIAKHFEEN